jgi:anaerobic magnesium-protoporphyrin IX monomethyl ester cyclase
MRVMLVDPPVFRVNRFTSITKLPSSAVLALNAHLLWRGHEVRVMDCRNQNLFYADIEREVAEFEPEVVGITGYSSDAYSAMIACESVKSACPSALTVMGGYHASAVPELTLLTCDALDVVVVGEGERTLDDLLELLASTGGWAPENLAGIAGIVFRSGPDCATRTGARSLVEQLDELAPGRYDNISTEYYQYPAQSRSASGANGFLFSASRGCTHACHYCSNQLLWRRTWRTLSPERMIDELRHLKERYGKDMLFLCDNDFLSDGERLRTFLDLLEAADFSIQWSIETSTAHVIQFRDLLPKMRKLGLFQCFVGFEFASAQKLRRMGKGLASLERSREAARLLRSHGIYVVALGMVGVPEETRESVLEHVAFFRSLDVDMVYTQCLTPLPGTRLFNDLLRSGQISSFDFNDYDLMTPTLEYDHLSCSEMKQLHVQSSDALFTPEVSRLYEDYRWKRISADELARRYAVLAGALGEYDNGTKTFNNFVATYVSMIMARVAPPDIVSTTTEPMSKRDQGRLRKRLAALDERESVMNPEGPGMAPDADVAELATLFERYFPREVLLRFVRFKPSRSDMLNPWLDMIRPEMDKETGKRLLMAKRIWTRRSRALLRIQTSLAAANPAYLCGDASLGQVRSCDSTPAFSGASDTARSADL